MLRIMMLGLVFPLVASSSIEKKEFSTTDLRELEIKNASGNVSIVGVSSGESVSVEVEKVKFDDHCKIEMERSKSKLRLVSKEGNSNWMRRITDDDCQVNFKIKVPVRLAMVVKNGVGDVDIEGAQGELEFKIGNGSASINADLSNVDGKIGNGYIEVQKLNGNADLKTGNGNIRVSYSPEAKRGDVNIKTGNGNATLFYPKDVKVKTDYKSGRGQLTNELGDAESPFKVTMRSGLGNLRIRALK